MIDLYRRRRQKFSHGIRKFKFGGNEYSVTYDIHANGMRDEKYYAVPREFRLRDTRETVVPTMQMKRSFAKEFNGFRDMINETASKERVEIMARLNGNIPEKYKGW